MDLTPHGHEKTKHSKWKMEVTKMED